MADNDSLDVTSPHEDRPKASFDDTIPSQLPQFIGRYKVEKLLGKGGFGLVFLAYDEQLNRQVAIKVPHAQLFSRPQDAESYWAEARTVASLDHPNIVPVHDVGSTAETPFYVVSKRIEGSDLSTILHESRFSHQQAAELVASVAEALHYAHKQGLVHRDIKPANILLDKNGTPFVVDFGLALREQDVGKGSRYVGTPAYMSPEQARGEGHRVDGRSDIFSLGIVFYELLVGRRPFRSDLRAELLEEIVSLEARPPRQIDDSVPKELDRICLRMLSKRASERYSTAKDVAEDVRQFLSDTTEESAPSLAANLHSRAPAVATVSQGKTPLATPALDSQPIKIVPKGLRSFDEHDADFFLELLPGPRDRDGLPDSIRFWKTRIEETDQDKTFSVGLIYGPSGCGKSSLVKAGLLPRLSKDVLPVYVEATSDETESRLLHGLRRKCPALGTDLCLKDTLASIRRGQGIPGDKKVLVIIDQFEQWLHAKKDGENSELVQALRQCDGEHVQCIVMVRDDFWMAATRFLADVEVELVQGRNLAAVDLFDLRHARRVLTAIGRAFGALSEGNTGANAEQQQFLDTAVSDLSEDGKVVCVRLALFAEMMKGKAWTPTTLIQVGGTKGIGVTFLEETFSSQAANPKHRLHQTAARAVLKALLPESGSNIKGNMRSYDELLGDSGYAARARDFDDLMRVLDSEIRLVTPTDPEGIAQGGSTGSEQKYYQLSHDYLVSSLRDWLTRKQRETRRGRAELRLVERAALWNAKTENRRLPSLWEYLNIRLFTTKSRWTDTQRKMLTTAGRFHAIRSGIATALAVGVFLAAWEVQGRFQAASLVDQLVSAEITEVPSIIEKLSGQSRWGRTRLETKDAEAPEGSREQLHIALALLPFDSKKLDYLREELVRLTPNQFPVVADALWPHKDTVTEPLWSTALDSTQAVDRRFQAACALARFAPGDVRWNQIDELVSKHLVSRQASEFLAWRAALSPAKSHLIDALAAIYPDTDEEQQNRRFAAEALGEYCSNDAPRLFDLLAEADHFQFPIILPKFSVHKEQGASLAKAELTTLPHEGATDDDKETLARRQVNAAAALSSMGVTEPVKTFLRPSPDPRARSYFIHLCGTLVANPHTFIEQCDAGADSSIRRALVLAIGELSEDQLSVMQRAALTEKLLIAYEHDTDAGLHSAIEWLLRKWQEDERLVVVKRRLESKEQKLSGRDTAECGWYLNSQGQTFVVVKEDEFWMGSPETEAGRHSSENLHQRRLRPFAIAATEVTQQQYERFASTVPEIAAEYHTHERAQIGTLPVSNVSWYEATQYCNWLSEQEGIPNEQWCYAPNDQGHFGLNMSAKLEFLDLAGYRLPTEAEWECACRAQTLTPRYHGLSEELLEHYAWCAPHADEHTWPVGLLKPNNMGLFDMLGNVSEWCQSRWDSYKNSNYIVGVRSKPESSEIPGSASLIYRGGSYFSRPRDVRSADRATAAPGSRYTTIGFRVARSIPALTSTSESPAPAKK